MAAVAPGSINATFGGPGLLEALHTNFFSRGQLETKIAQNRNPWLGEPAAWADWWLAASAKLVMFGDHDVLAAED
jgi:hypothetical protein